MRATSSMKEYIPMTIPLRLPVHRALAVRGWPGRTYVAIFYPPTASLSLAMEDSGLWESPITLHRPPEG